MFSRGPKLTPYTTGRKPWRNDSYEPQDLDGMRSAKQKLVWFGVVVFFVFGILSAQLVRMQLVNGPKYQQRAEFNRLREVPIQPTRGLIYDRNGKALVENIATFAATVVAADVPKAREDEITIALQELTGVAAGEIAAKIEARRESNDPFAPIVVKADLSQEVAFRLREHIPDLPGVQVTVQPQRRYPAGPLMANILGFLGAITEDEYAELEPKGYQLSDRLGKTGVESTYEAVLRGSPGLKDVETDATGRELNLISEMPAKPGNSIVLSIDSELQKATTDYLQAAMGTSRNAAAIVIDVKTGELLSLVSLPSYDNNIFTGDSEANDAAREALLTDPRKPMVDHAFAEMYAPGSTFKQITGLASLQEGVANANTMITSTGSITVKSEFDPNTSYIFRDWRSDLGTMNFYRGLAMSSDVYYYYLAGGFSVNGVDVFQGLGATRLADWARRFGLGDKTGIDLPGESEGLVPDPKWKEAQLGEVWTIGDTYNFGIGQGYLAATPIQMAVVTAAVANGGNVLTPHVVKEIRDPNGNVIPTNQNYVRRNLGVDQRNIAILREAMRQAVADGSAYTAQVKNVQVAGKTGTAEFGPRRPDGTYTEHGWFTGFAPYDNPQVAVAVFLDIGNGQGTAAPTAAKILDYYFNQRTVAQGQRP